MTTEITNKFEFISDTYTFKNVIQHVDILQAEIEFIEKYSHLLEDNKLLSKTLINYEAKTITIEAKTIKHFKPLKKMLNNKGFIFDLPNDMNVYNKFIQAFKSIGVESNDIALFLKDNKIVITSNKLSKEIIKNAQEVIALENRTETFTKSYKFDKRPSINELLHSQLNFITANKLHEDDIIFTSIYTTNEENTISISGKQSNKHKTYSDDVAAIINSCIIVDRFESLLESVLEQGSDNVIQRVISYQHPIVDSNSLELLESSVNITQVLEDITNKDDYINLTSSINEEDIAEFITDIPNNVDELIAETKAYQELEIRKNNSYYPPKDLLFTEDEIQKLKDFLKSL